jgi:hypothetical protein
MKRQHARGEVGDQQGEARRKRFRPPLAKVESEQVQLEKQLETLRGKTDHIFLPQETQMQEIQSLTSKWLETAQSVAMDLLEHYRKQQQQRTQNNDFEGEQVKPQTSDMHCMLMQLGINPEDLHWDEDEEQFRQKV